YTQTCTHRDVHRYINVHHPEYVCTEMYIQIWTHNRPICIQNTQIYIQNTQRTHREHTDMHTEHTDMHNTDIQNTHIYASYRYVHTHTPLCVHLWFLKLKRGDIFKTKKRKKVCGV